MRLPLSSGCSNPPTGVKIDQRIFSPLESLHAPHLLDVEVTQVLRRYVRDKAVTARRGQEALEDLAEVPLSRYPHDLLIPPHLGTPCNANRLRCGIRGAR